MDMVVSALSVLVFLSVSVFTWAVLPNAARQLVRRRIFSEVIKKQRPSLASVIGKALEPINRRLPLQGYCAWATALTEAAGSRLPPLHVLAMQEIGAMAGLLAFFIIAGVKLVSPGSKPVDPNWLLLFMAGGSVVPIFSLYNRIKTRRVTVMRDLPEIVDLLTLSVNAGSDFLTALTRIVREFRPCPVLDELGLVLQEIRVGKRRRDALRAFSLRLRTPETSTFARTLIQVDRMGTGMAEALSVLSEDMRLSRYHWAERYAQQAPMKMLLPLVMSLGAAMVIVAGPILMKFFRGDLISAPKMSAEQHRANSK